MSKDDIPIGYQLALLPETQLAFFHACFKHWGYWVKPSELKHPLLDKPIRQRATGGSIPIK